MWTSLVEFEGSDRCFHFLHIPAGKDTAAPVQIEKIQECEHEAVQFPLGIRGINEAVFIECFAVGGSRIAVAGGGKIFAQDLLPLTGSISS